MHAAVRVTFLTLCVSGCYYYYACRSEDDVYLAFGLSADPTTTVMQGADVTVAWVNRMAQANAVDYHLSGYIQVE